MSPAAVCMFNCAEVKCSTKNVFSFTNIICLYHLKLLLGISLWLFRSETATDTSLAGPFLIVDQDLVFETGTVVFPERDFLDSYLFPKVDQVDYQNYKLNPRLKFYLDMLNTRSLPFKNPDTYKTHLELIRNLSEPVIAPNTINIAGNDNTTYNMLKGEIAAKLNVLTNWVANEPYYKVFDKLTVIGEPNEPEIPIKNFSTFYAFMLFNCIYDRHEFQTQQQITSPVTCYANLKYIKGIGFVTIQDIPNPLPLCIMGTSKSSLSYYNMKTKTIPNVVAARHVDSRDFPDNNNIQNVIGDNRDYCRVKGMPTIRNL